MDDIKRIVRTEVLKYAGNGEGANIRLFPILDDEHATYTVNAIAHPRRDELADVVVLARIVKDMVVIEEDMTNKQLVRRANPGRHQARADLPGLRRRRLARRRLLPARQLKPLEIAKPLPAAPQALAKADLGLESQQPPRLAVVAISDGRVAGRLWHRHGRDGRARIFLDDGDKVRERDRRAAAQVDDLVS